MFGRWFEKRKEPQQNPAPQIMGLGLGSSFELDPLWLRITEPLLQTDGIAPTQIIQAVGKVDWDDTQIYRFYTDDEAWLQVVATGEQESDVVDVSLFHYFDTRDVASEQQWKELLNERIGAPSYQLNDRIYERVWTSEGSYHMPVHMRERTYQADKTFPSETDQFTMLFQRVLNDAGDVELLFVSAEEVQVNNNLERCLVLSTGVKLSPTQLTIHG